MVCECVCVVGGGRERVILALLNRVHCPKHPRCVTAPYIVVPVNTHIHKCGSPVYTDRRLSIVYLHYKV